MRLPSGCSMQVSLALPLVRTAATAQNVHCEQVKAKEQRFTGCFHVVSNRIQDERSPRSVFCALLDEHVSLHSSC